MSETISFFKRFKLGQMNRTAGQSARRSVLALALAFLAASVLPGLVDVTPAQAQKAKTKKLSKAQKTKRAKKLKKTKRARARKRAKAARRAKAQRKGSSVSGYLRAQNAYKAQLNQNTVTLMSGCCTSGAYTAFGADIKDMIKNSRAKNGLRVLPVLGGGAGTNVRDILFLRGVDMAILNTDVIDYYKDKPLYENLTKRIHYITKLFNEEVHVYGGATVTSLSDLNGKVVGFTNSSAEVTGSILFDKLGIKPSRTLQITEGDGALALREGRLDAMMSVTGKPIANVARLKAIFPQIKFLPIGYDPAFIGSHLPTQLTHEDYPELISKGQVVPTIAIRTILAVFNWQPKSERYRRLEKFTVSFFDNFTTLRQSKNLHPKWAEVNLQATVPGMTRFAPAKNWLQAKTALATRNNKDTGAGQNKKTRGDLMNKFKQFLASRDTSADQNDPEKLIGEFLRWRTQQR